MSIHNITSERMENGEILTRIAEGKVAPTDVLLALTEEQLASLFVSTFERNGAETVLTKGDGRSQGDISGQLVIDRTVGERLLEEAEERGTGIDFVYSPPQGSLEDAHVIEAAEGFFTEEQGESTFCAVQASCRGVPTIVGVNCSRRTRSEHEVLTYEFYDGSTLEIEEPVRTIAFTNGSDESEIAQSEVVSMSGATGEIFPRKSICFLCD